MTEMNEMIGRGNMTAVSSTEETKKIAEVQAKMILAQRFPRNAAYARQMIAMECENKDLAEKAIYVFPRGDSEVRGASIRLVECVARHWGNILCGVEEIASNKDSATVRAYCWDLQTNFADEKVFDVSFERTTKKGSYMLTDPRDRYEKLANDAARRKRACIQAIIPKFIIDEAMEICEKTLSGSINEKNIEETKAKMVNAFRAIAEWITEEDLAEKCGKDWANLGTHDIVKLRNLYNAVKDGFVKPSDAFGKQLPGDAEKPGQEEADRLGALNTMLGGEQGAADRG